MTTDQDPMIEFANQLFSKAGLDKMPEDFKKQYVEQIAFEAQRRLALVAEKELDKKAMKDYYKMVERGKMKPEEVLEFFKNNIENFEEKMQKALQEFGKEFLEEAKKLKGVKL